MVDAAMKHRVYFRAGIYQPATGQFAATIANILARPDCDDLTVLFSSEGGSTDEGFALYNFIRALKRPIHFHAIGHVGSMGLPVFMAAHQRTCSPLSRFFFHTYDWGFEGRQTLDRIAEASQRLESDIKLSREIIERHTRIPAETLAEVYSRATKPLIMTPHDALTTGVVSEIIELNPDGEIQPDVAIWTVG